MFEDVANVKLSTYAKELGLVSCAALILCGGLVACDTKISKDAKAASVENASPKKVGTHILSPKCGARISSAVNER